MHFRFSNRKNVLRYILISTVYLQICHSAIIPNAEISICRTPECNELDDFYKKIVNPNGNPCKDFYDYVCHGWSSQRPRPKHIELWADHEIMRQNALMKVKKLLEENKASDSQEEKTAKSVYQSCMNLPFITRQSPDDLKKLVTTVGNWPMFIRNDVLQAQQISWQNSEMLYMRIAGESSLLNYYFSAHGNKTVLSLEQPESPYGMLKRKVDWHFQSEKRNYMTFLTKVINGIAPLVGPKFEKIIEKDLVDVLFFRDQLRYILKKDGEKTIETVEISVFQEYYDRFHSSPISAQIDWLTMIRAMYKDSKNPLKNTIQSTSLIKVQPEYFRSLAKLLATTPSRVLGNHVHLYFAERHIILDQDMELTLQKCGSNDTPRMATIRYNRERFITCIRDTEMEDTVGKMYVNAYFSKKDKAAVTDMVLEGISLIKEQISKSKWVDPVLQKQWQHTFDDIDMQIGYPEWYYNKSQPFLPMAADVDPIEINIQYMPTLHEIGISAAYLQYPIYHANLPPVIRYAALLSTIAHELYHVFDYKDLDQTTLALNDTALQQKMNRKFRQQTQCFEDQYDKYRLKEFKKQEIKKKYGHPATVDEDIPDAMGLKLAYMGYKKRYSKEKCVTLPHFEEFGCDKLFFITFASTFCADYSQTMEKELLVLDIHNLPHIRVNGAVANMKEFGQTFNCPTGANLAPKETCDLWR